MLFIQFIIKKFMSEFGPKESEDVTTILKLLSPDDNAIRIMDVNIPRPRETKLPDYVRFGFDTSTTMLSIWTMETPKLVVPQTLPKFDRVDFE